MKTASGAHKIAPRMAKSTASSDIDLVPNVGEIVRRLRAQRKLTVSEVADRSELSPSFIRAIERGETDVSLGRIARLAAVFGYDLGSFLGFTTQLTRPNFVTKEDRKLINRGKGIRYECLRLPGVDFELEVVEFGPRTAFTKPLAHEGIDVLYVVSGKIILEFNGTDYPMLTGECCAFSAAYPHRVRNDSNTEARGISFTTGRM